MGRSQKKSQCSVATPFTLLLSAMKISNSFTRLELVNVCVWPLYCISNNLLSKFSAIDSMVASIDFSSLQNQSFLILFVYYFRVLVVIEILQVHGLSKSNVAEICCKAVTELVTNNPENRARFRILRARKGENFEFYQYFALKCPAVR